MDSIKITDIMTKLKNNKQVPSSQQPSQPKKISMLSIKEIIITSTSLGIPWLVLLRLAGILIFI